MKHRIGAWVAALGFAAAVCGLPGTGWSATEDEANKHAGGGIAAIMTSLVKDVTASKTREATRHLYESLGQYHDVMAAERVQDAEARVLASGCEGDACLVALREALGVPSVYRMYHVDEGYFNQIYITRATAEGLHHQHIVCSRCSMRTFRWTLDKVVSYMHFH